MKTLKFLSFSEIIGGFPGYLLNQNPGFNLMQEFKTNKETFDSIFLYTHFSLLTSAQLKYLIEKSQIKNQ